jgi:glycosyltransferase involved in cell wall biosynthesis
MTAPCISVIIPYYNAGAFIDETLTSVRRQTCSPCEVILVDDGSTDAIAARVKDLGDDIIFLQQPNKGPAAARNLGLDRARGEFIAFQDADDLWPNDKLALQAERLRQDPALGVVSGRITYLDLPGATALPMRMREDQTVSAVNLGATLIRREVFDAIGKFDETLHFSEDQDWFLRAREKDIKIAIMNNVTLICRRHADNMTRARNMRELGLLDVLKKSIARRKRASDGRPASLRPWSEYEDAG